MARYALYVERSGECIEIPNTRNSLQALDEFILGYDEKYNICDRQKGFKDEDALLAYFLGNKTLPMNHIYKKIRIGYHVEGRLIKRDPLYLGTTNSVMATFYQDMRKFAKDIGMLYDTYVKSVYDSKRSDYDYTSIALEMTTIERLREPAYIKIVKKLGEKYDADLSQIDIYEGFVARGEPISEEIYNGFCMGMLRTLNRIFRKKNNGVYEFYYPGFRNFVTKYYDTYGKSIEHNHQLVLQERRNRIKQVASDGQTTLMDLFGLQEEDTVTKGK